MSTLNIKPAGSCQYDCISLGEIMLRFDPGEGRIRSARQFKVWEGGGEYNVTRGLRKCFGMRTAVVTAFADNEVGRLAEDFILQGGVDVALIKWVPYDGIGRTVRNGLNFTERGFGIRSALGCYDRGMTAASQLKKGDIDWESIFGAKGSRWFHTGGIYAGLSETTPDVILEAMAAARKQGTIISYDLNYRPSLWKAIGGQAKAIEVNREMARHVDVMMGNSEQYTTIFGVNIDASDVGDCKRMFKQLSRSYPNIKVIGATLRTVKTATINRWSAMCWTQSSVHLSNVWENLEILDTVGGGDSFASGLIFGFMETGDPQQAVEYGVAHGALAMTTPGDNSMATKDEVEKVMKGGSARVVQ